MGTKTESYFTSIPLKKRDSYITELSKKYEALCEVLKGKLENATDDKQLINYDGVHSCPINELYVIDKEELKEKIIRLEYEIKVIKETLL